MAEENLAEHIADRLRRAILRGTLPPGAPIKERDNAADLGVSRTPLREAIRMLAKEGLVVLRPARSPRVAVADPKEAGDQVAVLIALEKLSGEWACTHATKAQIDRIEALLDSMARDFDRVDPLDLFERDMAFHSAIAEASGNRALAETHRTYLRRLWRVRYLAASQRPAGDRVLREHGAIVAALRARDPEATRAAIARHLLRLADDIHRLLESEAGGPKMPPTPQPQDSQ